MNRHTFFKTLKGKIIAITLGTTLLITLVTVAVCFYVFQSLLRRNQIQSVEFNLQLVANNVSSDMKDLVYFANWCRLNNDILGYLETFHDKEPLAIVSKKDKGLRAVAINSFNRLKEEYYNTRPSRYITRLIISNNTTTNFLQIMATSGETFSYKVSSLAELDMFQTLLSSPDFQWIGIINDPFSQEKGPSVPIIPMVRPIYNTFGADVIGWVYMSVSSNVIMDNLKSFPYPQDSRVYLTIGPKCYLLKGNECQEIEPDYEVLSEEKAKDLDAGTLVEKVVMDSGKKETLITRPLGQEGWYIHQILSREQMEQQREVYLLLIAGICAVILSLGLFMVYSLTRTINQPVSKIQKKINEIAHGDFSRDDSIEWNHELGDIGRGINNLSRDVVGLMEKRIDDERQKKGGTGSGKRLFSYPAVSLWRQHFHRIQY